jgi:hypothetical protein
MTPEGITHANKRFSIFLVVFACFALLTAIVIYDVVRFAIIVFALKVIFGS